MRSNSHTSLNKIEQIVFDMLREMHFQFETQVKIDKYNVDFLVNNKYIIECYGDFWHCNPEQYNADYYNKGKKKKANEIWRRDLERRQTFETMGYKFINLWECDIKDNKKKVRSRLKKYLR